MKPAKLPAISRVQPVTAQGKSKNPKDKIMKMVESYNLSRTEWENLIDEYIFNEKHRKIIKRRMLDGVYFDKLAEQEEMSTQQVKTIVYKCQKILLRHLK